MRNTIQIFLTEFNCPSECYYLQSFSWTLTNSIYNHLYSPKPKTKNQNWKIVFHTAKLRYRNTIRYGQKIIENKMSDKYSSQADRLTQLHLSSAPSLATTIAAKTMRWIGSDSNAVDTIHTMHFSFVWRAEHCKSGRKKQSPNKTQSDRKRVK